MGLKDYKKWKFEKMLEESELVSSLRNEIKELKSLLTQQRVPQNASLDNVVLTDEQKKLIKDAKEAGKPQDFINLFTSDLEEFNPNA